jgi:hypothetical protein
MQQKRPPYNQGGLAFTTIAPPVAQWCRFFYLELLQPTTNMEGDWPEYDSQSKGLTEFMPQCRDRPTNSFNPFYSMSYLSLHSKMERSH